MNPINQELQKTMKLWADQLKLTPNDTDLRAKILTTQVYITGQQLGVSDIEASNVVKSYTAAYAHTQGIDPKSILDALTVEEQNILNYSKSNPKLYGVSLSTANQIAGVMGAAAGILTTISMGLVLFGLFTIGPELFAAFEGISSIAGVLSSLAGSRIIAGATITFIMGQVLGHIATNIPMITKQMIDNGSIGPGLRISALTDAEKLRQQINGTAAPGSFTSAQFKSYAKAIEAAGVTSINDPQSQSSIPYSEGALANLIIYVTGQETLKGNKSTFTAIKNQLAQYLVSSNGKNAVMKATASVAEIQQSNTGGGGGTTPTVKVFTGIVSQGVVGAGLSFTPRPDDMIESVEELRTAASNNLAPFLNSLLGKIVYEVKVVASVVTKDGFKQTGTTQRLQTGTFANGTPKYKTVTNKFATLVVYALTDKGSRAKLTTIVLGPTDSSKLTVGQNDLRTLETELPTLVTTTDINEVTNIKNVTDKFDTTTGNPNPDYIPPPPPTDNFDRTKGVVVTAQTYKTYTDQGWLIDASGAQTMAYPPKSGTGTNTHAPATVPIVTPPGTGTGKRGANASTLFEWYQAQGQNLPSLSARSQIYAGFGLGQASYYTGTAEQNTKLLNALKAN